MQTGRIPALTGAGENPLCPICATPAESIGSKTGGYFKRDFHYAECGACGLIFCIDPATNYAEIYDHAYYRGIGADPLVDYEYELQNPEGTIRRYEWRGIGKIVRNLTSGKPNARWLDFGCGTGGLVRYGREIMGADIYGYDTGAYAERARAMGLPILLDTELEAQAGTFDVITLIEVIEHVVEPVPFMAKLRSLLKPGGLLFLTTGNSEPHRRRFLNWGYVVPEVHVCFYTPKAMAILYSETNLNPLYSGGLVDGWTDIIRYKVLKNLGVRKAPVWDALIPWSLATRIVDARYRSSAFPLGVGPLDGEGAAALPPA
jgi:SAM-dependent methyltransferase